MEIRENEIGGVGFPGAYGAPTRLQAKPFNHSPAAAATPSRSQSSPPPGCPISPVKCSVSRLFIFFLTTSLMGWLVADGWCWFVLRQEYCWLLAGGWFFFEKKSVEYDSIAHPPIWFKLPTE
jgi:hypothetical protein